MNRKEAINIIEQSYPADSQLITIAITGQRLLTQARHEAMDWRDQPEPVLQRYAELCREEARRRNREQSRSKEYYGYGGTFASHTAEKTGQ